LPYAEKSLAFGKEKGKKRELPSLSFSHLRGKGGGVKRLAVSLTLLIGSRERSTPSTSPARRKRKGN